MSLMHGVLGFLNYGKMSGYDLAKAFNSSVQFFWHAQNSQIYLVLDKLEKQGFVTHELIIQSDKPNKKLYCITESGRNEFIRWLSDENGNHSNEFKSAFLMKVFFSGNVSPKQSINMLKKFAEDCKSYLNSMDSIPESIESYGAEVPNHNKLYWQFTADYGYMYTNMCISWAESCIKKLEEIS